MVDYNWFFSSLVQALAAMIGVIGMFAVYRLQVQEERVRKVEQNRYDLANTTIIQNQPAIHSTLGKLNAADEAILIEKNRKANISKQAFNLICLLCCVFIFNVIGLIYAKGLTGSELKPPSINTLIRGYRFLGFILGCVVLVMVRLVFFCKTCFEE